MHEPQAKASATLLTGSLSERLAAARPLRRTAPQGFALAFATAADGAQIRYGLAPALRPEARGTVLFVPGRTEFIEKAFEDMHLFHSLGYAVAGMDLRGQGLSHRECTDREKHYVTSFDKHIGDMDVVIDALVAAGAPGPFLLAAHSAGSHASLRYMHDHGTRIDRAITVSPMVRIFSGGLPVFMMRGLAGLMCRMGNENGYVPGHEAFKEGRWGWRAKLTHDDERFLDEDHFIQTVDRNLAVGGATWRWLLEAVKSTDVLNSPGYPEAIRNPVLMLQAGEDQIVDNKAMSAFAARMPNCRLVRIEGAMHEMYKETDRVRAELWVAIVDFLDLGGEFPS